MTIIAVVAILLSHFTLFHSKLYKWILSFSFYPHMLFHRIACPSLLFDSRCVAILLANRITIQFSFIYYFIDICTICPDPYRLVLSYPALFSFSHLLSAFLNFNSNRWIFHKNIRRYHTLVFFFLTFVFNGIKRWIFYVTDVYLSLISLCVFVYVRNKHCLFGVARSFFIIRLP